MSLEYGKLLDKAYNRQISLYTVKQQAPERTGLWSGLLNYILPLQPVINSKIAFVGDEDHQNLIACFNIKPIKALNKWLDGASEDESIDLINWLMTAHKNLISPVIIGELLSDAASDTLPWSKNLCSAYLNQRFDFKGKSIFEAFKMFLEADFRLPGEAQKIDRLMQQFSNKYMLDNPENPYLQNADSAYLLAFAMIMLNTDLHNSSIKQKMTLDQFKRNTGGGNAGKDFEPSFLSKIYESIKHNEIVRTGDDFVCRYADKADLDNLKSYHEKMIEVEFVNPDLILNAFQSPLKRRAIEIEGSEELQAVDSLDQPSSHVKHEQKNEDVGTKRKRTLN